MIRKILVPVRGDGKGDNVYAHAAAIAKAAKAHVEVTHCRPKPEDFLPYGIPVPHMMRDQFFDQAKTLADHEETVIRSEFETLSKEFGLKIVEKQGRTGPSASWVEEVGKQVDVIKSRGLLSDLIAVAQPDRDTNLGMNTLKTALFSTGRPVMMVPAKAKATKALGQKITIAWNGSTESVRCVVMARRLIQHAKKITILTIGETREGISGEDFQDYLSLRDIPSELFSLTKTKSVAKTLLRATEDADASVMLMGAYGENHYREAVFGGNTQEVVEFAKIPVIMAH